MSGKEKKAGNFVGFTPNKAGGGINSPDKIDDPLIEGAVFQGEEGEAGAKEDREDDEGPLEDEDQIAGEKKIGEEQAEGELEELFERHVADQAELVLGDVLGDGVLLHGSSIAGNAHKSQIIPGRWGRRPS